MKSHQEPSTRRSIMIMLKTQGPFSVSELARELNITEMAVRRHIHTLDQEGLLITETVRIPTGRPFLRFRLSERAEEHFPHNYHQLALDLLSELDEDAVAVLFEGRKQKLLSRYQSIADTQDHKERVATLTDIQHHGGYMARYEQQSEDQYTIYEYNCPINQIANRYDIACQCEQQLFEQLLQADVKRTECIAKGGHCCVYQIQFPSNSVADSE